MSTYLTYPGQPARTETDLEVITNLTRKGWVESEAPAPPEPSEEQTRETVSRAAIDAGFLVEPEGYHLRWDSGDREYWSQMLTLYREAESLGAMTGESPVQFVDQTGTVQTATLTRFRQIMVTLGAAFQTVFFARYGS